MMDHPFLLSDHHLVLYGLDGFGPHMKGEGKPLHPDDFANDLTGEDYLRQRRTQISAYRKAYNLRGWRWHEGSD